MPQRCSRFTSGRAVGCVAAWAVAAFKCLATDLVQQTAGLAGFVRLHRAGFGSSRDSFAEGQSP